MGASIFVEWPGSTEDQRNAQPGFSQDCHMWSSFVVECMGSPEAEGALSSIEADVLLYGNTDGLSESEIEWAPPQQFINAATSLRTCLEQSDERVLPLLEVYAKEWNRLCEPDDGTPEEWLVRDLQDVESISRYAASNGAQQMTLGYYW